MQKKKHFLGDIVLFVNLEIVTKIQNLPIKIGSLLVFFRHPLWPNDKRRTTAKLR